MQGSLTLFIYHRYFGHIIGGGNLDGTDKKSILLQSSEGTCLEDGLLSRVAGNATYGV